MKKKLSIFGLCVVLLAVALVITFRVMPGQAEVIQPELAPGIESVSTAPNSTSSISVPPIKPLPSSSSEGQKPLEDKEPPQENSHVITTEEDGSITDETVRPEFSKPEVPNQPPELAEGSTLDDPDNPPEYVSNSSTDTSQPNMGDKKTENGTNYIWITGFGWTVYNPGMDVTYLPNAGTGDEIIGH